MQGKVLVTKGSGDHPYGGRERAINLFNNFVSAAEVGFIYYV
jgi:hypothetical protein